MVLLKVLHTNYLYTRTIKNKSWYICCVTILNELNKSCLKCLSYIEFCICFIIFRIIHDNITFTEDKHPAC